MILLGFTTQWWTGVRLRPDAKARPWSAYIRTNSIPINAHVSSSGNCYDDGQRSETFVFNFKNSFLNGHISARNSNQSVAKTFEESFCSGVQRRVLDNAPHVFIHHQKKAPASKQWLKANSLINDNSRKSLLFKCCIYQFSIQCPRPRPRGAPLNPPLREHEHSESRQKK
jgi:hypothetical protein